jgi:magnesium transporter
MVFISQLLGKPVIDSENNILGVLSDLVFADGPEYADVTHIVYKCKEKYHKRLPWEYVAGIKQTATKDVPEFSLVLNTDAVDLHPSFVHQKDLLAKELLDKQIIDVSGLKVVRVNDILLNKVKGDFGVTGVCVGTASFLRRLGVQSKGLGSHLFKFTTEQIIPWRSVESFETNVHLKEPGNKIADLHPGDIADIMEELSPKEQMLIFNKLDKKTAAKALVEADEDVQESFLRDVKSARIIELLESLAPYRAADLLGMIDDSVRVDKILSQIQVTKAKKIRELLQYEDDCAGGLMRVEVFTFLSSYTAKKAIHKIRKEKPPADQMHVLLVVDSKNRLLGTVSIRTLLTASPRDKLEDVMSPDPITVNLTTSKQDIAIALEKYNFVMLPVVDKNNVLLGTVTADEVLSEIIPDSWIKRKYVPQRTHKKRRKI